MISGDHPDIHSFSLKICQCLISIFPNGIRQSDHTDRHQLFRKSGIICPDSFCISNGNHSAAFPHLTFCFSVQISIDFFRCSKENRSFVCITHCTPFSPGRKWNPMLYFPLLRGVIFCPQCPDRCIVIFTSAQIFLQHLLNKLRRHSTGIDLLADLHLSIRDRTGLVKAQHIHSCQRFQCVHVLYQYFHLRQADHTRSKGYGDQQYQSLRKHTKQGCRKGHDCRIKGLSTQYRCFQKKQDSQRNDQESSPAGHRTHGT